jgi:peptidoglycan L-alanyl-D-glutamate endopeptidase CwlK
MSLSDDQAAFLTDFCLLVQYAKGLGFKITPGELRRTFEQQRIYFNTGRSKTMYSSHLIAMAGDLNFFLNGVYVNALPGEKALEILKPIGEFWESLNFKNVWGGNFDRDFSRKDPWVDTPHFQRNA